MADVFTSHLEWTGATRPTTSVTSYRRDLVDEAHRQCIIANSVQVRLDIEPTFVLAEALS